VDLRRRAAAGITTLRPLQIAYESPRFMLPVRLGMANANGPQELFVYAVTRTGRVEPVNYRGLKLPDAVDAPAFVKSDFNSVWRAAFDHLVDENGMGVVYTEYAWDMTWCDPCPSPPLDRDEMRSLGVWWLDDPSDRTVFLTRLHARYDRASFPEDLVLQATADRTNFQVRGGERLRQLAAGAARARGQLARRVHRLVRGPGAHAHGREHGVAPPG